MAIRYDKNLNIEIQRVVKNFNQKVERLERLNDKLGLYKVPDKVSIKELKASSESRTELKRALNNLRLFSKRGIENTVETTSGLMSEYELALYKKEQRRVKSYYTRQINKYKSLSPHIAGSKQKGTFETLGSEYLQQLERRRAYISKDITLLDKDQLDYYIKALDAVRNEAYKAQTLYKNYLDDMLFKLGYASDYDSKKLDIIKEKLSELTPVQLSNALRIESALQTVTDYYADIHNQSSLEDNKADIREKYDVLFENIDQIVEQAKNGY